MPVLGAVQQTVFSSLLAAAPSHCCTLNASRWRAEERSCQLLHVQSVATFHGTEGLLTRPSASRSPEVPLTWILFGMAS